VQGQDFLNLVGDNFLTQKVFAPTRGNNILDLVLCSDPDIVENLVVGCSIANSDHNLLEFDIVWGGDNRGVSSEKSFATIRGITAI